MVYKRRMTQVCFVFSPKNQFQFFFYRYGGIPQWWSLRKFTALGSISSTGTSKHFWVWCVCAHVNVCMNTPIFEIFSDFTCVYSHTYPHNLLWCFWMLSLSKENCTSYFHLTLNSDPSHSSSSENFKKVFLTFIFILRAWVLSKSGMKT